MDLTRHSKLVEGVDLKIPVHIVGCGSIGTAAATTMARLGFSEFVLYDEDSVEPHNIANQFFEEADCGELKTRALKSKIEKINPGAKVRLTGFFYNDTKVVTKAVYIVGADNMKTRSEVASALKGKNSVLIDGRMGGNEGQVHALLASDKKAFDAYAQSLYSDARASELPCTSRSVIYTISVIGGLIGSLVLRLMKKENKYRMAVIDMANTEVSTVVAQ